MAPVGAAPSMLRLGQRALTFPRTTLKARIAHAPLGYPLFSSFLSSFLSGQTARRCSHGVKKQVSEPAPISLLWTDVRLSRPFTEGPLFASAPPAPLSVVLGVLSSAAPPLSSTRQPCMPYLLPGWHGRSQRPRRCALRKRAFRGVAKVLDCLPSGPFWTSFW